MKIDNITAGRKNTIITTANNYGHARIDDVTSWCQQRYKPNGNNHSGSLTISDASAGKKNTITTTAENYVIPQ
ncbi:MAG TPA: hypothetical protein ACHBX0_04190 [Arsenophonus sp.]